MCAHYSTYQNKSDFDIIKKEYTIYLNAVSCIIENLEELRDLLIEDPTNKELKRKLSDENRRLVLIEGYRIFIQQKKSQMPRKISTQ